MKRISTYIFFALLSCLAVIAKKPCKLQGTINPGLGYDHLLLYIINVENPDFDADYIIKVKKDKFSFKMNTDSPVPVMLKGVRPDNSVGEYQELWLVPGQTCKIQIEGDRWNQFTVSGSDFYQQWQFTKDAFDKMHELLHAGEEAQEADRKYVASIKTFQMEHAKDIGSVIYQLHWKILGLTIEMIPQDALEGLFKDYFKFYEEKGVLRSSAKSIIL